MLGSITDRSISGTRFLKISSADFWSSMTSRQPMYEASRKARSIIGRSFIVFSLAMMDMLYISKPCSAQGIMTALPLPMAFS